MANENGQQQLAQVCDVSRETFDKLKQFSALLVKWNAKINLVSPATIPHLWDRHIVDSAQLSPMIPVETKSLVDIGTGGGFPGLILAVIGQETHPDMKVTLVESDARKCAFLQTAAAQLKLGVHVITDRIEQVDPLTADILTSRALAPGPLLMSFAYRHLTEGGKALLLKGANAQTEVDESLASWSFDLQKRSSKTNADAVVLEVSNLRPR